MNRRLVHELSPAPDPADVCAALEGLPHRVFFDSAEPDGKYARYSFVAADPGQVIVSKSGATKISGRGPGLQSAVSENALESMRALVQTFPPAVAGIPPFQGGLAGYIGYEFGSALERIKPIRPDDLQIPDLCFGLYDTVFAWDHSTNQAWLISESADRQTFFLERLDRMDLRKTVSGKRHETSAATSSLSRQEYRSAIHSIREYISAGDIFQANFAQRFEASLNAEPWDLYLALRAKNPAPFACYFEAGEISVISASPERFIRLSENRAETRPIKGTRPRKDIPAADRESSDELVASVKDNAEHVMIVDVLRNDFSRVCAPGTVKVDELAVLESHPTVHHLVSTITGELQPGRDAIDLLLASIPGGSITGAPKIRAMEIIAELEPVRRDVYCGCMAYISAGGAMDSSIVIRTFLAKARRVYFSAGGGIVADSDPDMEFEETLHKASALFAALESVS